MEIICQKEFHHKIGNTEWWFFVPLGRQNLADNSLWQIESMN
jgi:hypothetical protein